jgi:ribosomal protein S18 acetylase RimI-like enzyme
VTAKITDSQLLIEPLDPRKHDRAAFSCGVAQVDNYFKATANKLAKADNARVWVLVSPKSELMGFYSMNAHAVDYKDLPAKFARTRPAHGNIPAAYISMIGIDRKFAGCGLGDLLLVDALKKIAESAERLGIAVILLDILDCGNSELVEKRKKLYKSRGFIALPSNELRMFLPVSTVKAMLEAEG